MKFLSKLVIAGLLFAAAGTAVFADIAFSTQTLVHFYMDGEEVHDSLDYEIHCYGYSTGIPGSQDYVSGLAPGTYDEEEMFTALQVCDEFGCESKNSYYLNYKVIDYCDLKATIGDSVYELKKYDTTPVPPVSREPEGEFEQKYLAFFDLVTGMMVYKDVDSAHTNFDAIKFISRQGIVNGYEDGTFKPASTMNRAEFTKILMLAAYSQYDIDECDTDEYSFSDVPADSWFAPYVCKAKEEGIIVGYGDGTFGAGNTINFAEASKIMVSTLGFEFAGAGSPWYKPFVDVLETKNAIPVSLGDYTDALTRGEMAEMIYRLKANVTDKSSAHPSQDW